MHLHFIGSDTTKQVISEKLPDLNIHLVSQENPKNALTIVDLTHLEKTGTPLENLAINLQNAIALHDENSCYSREELLYFYNFLDCVKPEDDIRTVVMFYK